MKTIYYYQSFCGLDKLLTHINDIDVIILSSIHFGINSDKIENCFSDETIENKVLNGRIEGHKKYSISSTPTIIINEKKFNGSKDFTNIEKVIKKNI